MKTNNIKTKLLSAIIVKILLLTFILLSIPLHAEEDKAKTGWRKTAAELDSAGSDAGDAIDNAIDKTTKKIIGQSAGDKVGKAKNALGIVDDTLDIVDKTTTIVEGIQEGDAAKVISPIVGQDTADKVSAKEAKEYNKEEGKALTAKEEEIRQAIKYKLKRKGATKEELKEAMKYYDNGDKKKFHNAVKKVKDKGIEDKEKNKHGLTPDNKNDDEYNVKDQLYEGAKAAAKKADDFYGGIVQKQQASNAEFEKLKKEQDQTQQGIQDEVDNAVVKKMMRKGVPYKEARAAVDAKRNGDASKFNKLTKKLAAAGKEDPAKIKGLSAEGKTATFEGGDYAEDIIDKEKQAWEGRSKKMMRPINKVTDYLDKKDLEEKDKQQYENSTYGKFRKAGATKKEARAAANDYADGKPEKAIKLAKKLIERQKQAKSSAENKVNVDKSTKDNKEADDLFDDDDKDNDTAGSNEADDIFADNDSSDNDNTESTGKDLQDSEYNDDYVDLPDDNQKDTAETAILRKELKRQKENAFSAKVNKNKNDMANASTSGDQSVRDSQTKIDQANVEGESVKVAAADKSNADYQNNSFGEQMSSEINEGIKTGMAAAGTAVGTAIGEAMARKIINKDRREERREEWDDNQSGNQDNEDSPRNKDSNVAQRSSGGSSRSGQVSGGKPGPSKPYIVKKSTKGRKPSSSRYITCAMCGLSNKDMLYEQIKGKWYCTSCAQKIYNDKQNRDTPKTPRKSGSHKCCYCGAPGEYTTDDIHFYCGSHVVYMPLNKKGLMGVHPPGDPWKDEE
jgi:hypothetical protein